MRFVHVPSLTPSFNFLYARNKFSAQLVTFNKDSCSAEIFRPRSVNKLNFWLSNSVLFFFFFFFGDWELKPQFATAESENVDKAKNKGKNKCRRYLRLALSLSAQARRTRSMQIAIFSLLFF